MDRRNTARCGQGKRGSFLYYWHYFDKKNSSDVCKSRHSEFNKRLKRPDIDLNSFEEGSPLRYACSHGCLKIVKMVTKAGGKINAKDKNNWTPLHEVSRVNGVAACKYLLQRGADTTTEDNRRLLPLHIACGQGHLGVIQVLADFMKKKRSGVNPFNIISTGQTPFMSAITSGCFEVVKYMIDNGADVNILSDTDMLPLHFAASSCNGDIYNLVKSKTEIDLILKHCTFPEIIETTDRMEKDWLSESFWSRSILCRAICCQNEPFIETVIKSKMPSGVLSGPQVVYICPEDGKKYILFTPLYLLFFSFQYIDDNIVNVLKMLIDNEVCGADTLFNSDMYILGPIEITLNSPCRWGAEFKMLNYLLANGANPDEGCTDVPTLQSSLQIRRSKSIMCQFEAVTDENCTNPPTELLKICVKLRTDKRIIMLLLKASNIVEPEDLLRWIVVNRDSKLIEDNVEQDLAYMLLTLSPYYTVTPSVYDFFMKLHCECDCLQQGNVSEKMKQIYEQPVWSLKNYCRSVVRRQLHNETRNNHRQFKEILNSLYVPETVLSYLKFDEVKFSFSECPNSQELSKLIFVYEE